MNVAVTDGRSSEDLLNGYRAALLVPFAAAVVAVGVAALGLRRRPESAAEAGCACH